MRFEDRKENTERMRKMRLLNFEVLLPSLLLSIWNSSRFICTIFFHIGRGDKVWVSREIDTWSSVTISGPKRRNAQNVMQTRHKKKRWEIFFAAKITLAINFFLLYSRNFIEMNFLLEKSAALLFAVSVVWRENFLPYHTTQHGGIMEKKCQGTLILSTKISRANMSLYCLSKSLFFGSFQLQNSLNPR